MSIRKYLAATALASVAVGSPASAALLDFNITGSSNAVSFQVDSNPSMFDTLADRIAIRSDVKVNGTTYSDANISFQGKSDAPEALRIGTSSGLIAFYYGPVLFQGSPTAPTFSTGTISLTDVLTGNGGPATLTISLAPTVTPVVPEPATWATMLIGFGMIGAVSRYRRRSVKALLA